VVLKIKAAGLWTFDVSNFFVKRNLFSFYGMDGPCAFSFFSMLAGLAMISALCEGRLENFVLVVPLACGGKT
jgi:hypothetical protein